MFFKAKGGGNVLTMDAFNEIWLNDWLPPFMTDSLHL